MKQTKKENLQQIFFYVVVSQSLMLSVTVLVVLLLEGTGRINLPNLPLVSLLGAAYGHGSAIFLILARFLFNK
jgi:hypothetical protein